MTKKDYEAIALAFQDVRAGGIRDNPEYYNGFMEAWILCCQSVARAMARDNVRFDSGRFLRACEPGANVKAR